MIDLHCHILPGIDDGAKTLEDSVLMANKAVEQGITHILCTPHHMNGKYKNKANEVIIRVAKLQEVLNFQNIPLTLLEGQEVRIFGDILKAIDNNEILFTDIDNTYLLIEFPTAEVPAYTEKIFFELLNQGHTPIIVHPERNAYFRENPNRLIPFIEMGVLTQITAPSILGIFGKDIQKTAMQMIKNNLGHMIASDAHNLSQRGFYLKEAYGLIEKEYSKEKAIKMKQVARDVLNGDKIEMPEYSYVKRGFSVFRRR
jgi:protein-tyrosine phosphatase